MGQSRRIAIVGNGEQAEGAAAVIDSADLVIRFNDCRSLGPGGTRTDVVVVCNTGRPGKAMIGGEAWRANPAVAAAGEIWSIRDPEKFRAMRGMLAESHPTLEDFCDDYTVDFAAYAVAAGKRHRVVPRLVHEGLDEALKAFEPEPYVVPSTGAVTIADLLAGASGIEEPILISGFGHQGWVLHPFGAERRWVEHLVAAGRLRRLEAGSDQTQEQAPRPSGPAP